MKEQTKRNKKKQCKSRHKGDRCTRKMKFVFSNIHPVIREEFQFKIQLYLAHFFLRASIFAIECKQKKSYKRATDLLHKVCMEQNTNVTKKKEGIRGAMVAVASFLKVHESAKCELSMEEMVVCTKSNFNNLPINVVSLRAQLNCL